MRRTTACAITWAAECRITFSASLPIVQASVTAVLAQRFAPLGDPLIDRPAERPACDNTEVVLVGSRDDALGPQLVVEVRERGSALLLDEHLDGDLSLVVLADYVLERTRHELVVGRKRSGRVARLRVVRGQAPGNVGHALLDPGRDLRTRDRARDRVVELVGQD